MTRDQLLNKPKAPIIGPHSPVGAPSEAARLFKKKCNMCHSVESHGIKRLHDDHSDAGNAVTADFEWIKRFLQQEELKDDAKHQLEYTGDEKDLDTILKWVLSLKKS